MSLESNIAEDTDLRSLFKLADEIGNKHYRSVRIQVENARGGKIG